MSLFQPRALVLTLISFFLVNLSLVDASSSPLKKVMIVHSYEPGQVCGQPQADGLVHGLATGGYEVGDNLELHHFYMDTKRVYTSQEQITQRGARALEMIAQLQPDLVVTIDDNAAQTVMLALAGSNTPVVFSGLNRLPEEYHAQKPFMASRKKPGSNITGVYEKLHIERSLEVMRAIVELRKVALVVDASPSGLAVAQQVRGEMAKSSMPVEIVYHPVENFDQFKRTILAINQDPTIGAVLPITTTLASAYEQPVTTKEIFTWFLANSQKPDMALNYFFARLGLFGGAAIDFLAMGSQAGQKAAAILDGAAAGDIAIEDAREQSLVFNLERAKQLGIEVPMDILSAANLLYDDMLLKQKQKPLRLLLVQSYEKGVGCGATIEKGLLKGLELSGWRDGQRLDLFHYYMDTQHKHITASAIKKQAQLALADIKALDPDLVVLMDDNAFEHVLPPLVDSKYPVLFGGTNVPLEEYNKGFTFMESRQKPGKNVTGVTEEHELLQSLRLLKGIVPQVKTGVIIYADTTPFVQRMAKANEAVIARQVGKLPIDFMEPSYVRTLADYKAEVLRYNNDPRVDVIYSFAPLSLLNEDGLGTPVNEVVAWMAAHQTKPGFTWMTNWVKLGYLASAGIDLVAAGEELAAKAVQIIKGLKPGSLAITNPAKYAIALNQGRAKRLGITIPIDILEAAEVVYPGNAF